MYGTIPFKRRDNGLVYDVIPQIVDINFNGRYELRYNIGIMGHNGFDSICCIYDNDEFNSLYKRVEWNQKLKEWIDAD